MALTVLDRAERLFAAARHAELITLLEPQVPVYRDSARFYYLLGASCLRTGDIGGASTYLKRAESLSPLDIDVLLALSALEVRRGDSKKAVDGYLRVLELKPGERRALKGLDILRTEGSPEGLAALVSSGRIQSLYPGGRNLQPLFRGTLRLIIALAIVTVVGFALYRAVQSISVSRQPRPEVAEVLLNASEKNAPVTTSGSFRYTLTEKEVLSSFEKAKQYFQEYRDNAAIIEINRILGSNASAQVKAKAATLKNFVGKPDFRTVKDVPTFSEITADPWLYDGCSIVWKGMAANVQQRGSLVSFDFLVGYHEKNRLEGIAKAQISDVAVPLDRPLELLATLSTAGGTVFLEGTAIHELGVSGK